mmetsp:Transcript_22043/g.47836  ORF Transcript_22043/g.47836 Transcript_22043/m.47836 type:complete len:898 (+) Transcript_22043:98-2791(+)
MTRRKAMKRPAAATVVCCCLAAASSISAVTSSSINGARPPPSKLSKRQRRRLPEDHKKGHSYEASVQDKGFDEEENQSLGMLMLGSSSNSGGSRPETEQPSDGTDAADAISANSASEPATSLSPYTRISGAGSYSISSPDRFPYMASFQIEGTNAQSGSYDYHMCGGFLVAPDIIMTAAHCATYSPAGSDEVYQAFNGIEIGRLNLGEEKAYDAFENESYRLNYENLIPEKLMKHPKYDEVTMEHDLMLVKVFGKSRYPVVNVNSEASAPHDGERVTVLEWGATEGNSGKKYSDEMKEADLNILSNQDCRNTQVDVTDPTTGQTSSMSLQDHIFDDMMCASAFGRHICYGDAGGPVISRGNDEGGADDTVLGIISWGYGCVNPDYPAVITRISSHYQWIRTVVCKESSDAPASFNCGNQEMTLQNAGGLQTVTLKLKLDMMSVETGFVIQTLDKKKVVAQRTPGYYKSEKSNIVRERMDLPGGQCYKLILLDSFGDGFCCDMGGGSGMLYLGTDTGYYSGELLVDVGGQFEYDNQGEFCLASAPVNSIVPGNQGGISAVNVPTPSSNAGTPKPPTKSPSYVSATDNLPSGGSGWNGPVTNPEFEYCNQFCQSNSNALNCGSHTCYHNGDVQVTDGVQGTDEPTQTPFNPQGDLFDTSEYHLTVQFQFDERPEEVSWVLYDLTKNEVKVFVDFDVYTSENFANQLLNVVVNVDGPDAGEKQYAFTVYDKASNGLCCENGDGYYKVFLGDTADGMQLLGDDEYEFSSSYYFTLFENGTMAENDATLSTAAPTDAVTNPPTPKPSPNPTAVPTNEPTSSPTTSAPTFPWERRRPELMDEIGARWNSAAITPPGKFNDVGGDQRKYDFNVRVGEGSSGGSALILRMGVMALVLLSTFALIQ